MSKALCILKLRKKIIAYVKDEETNLNYMTIALKRKKKMSIIIYAKKSFHSFK